VRVTSAAAIFSAADGVGSGVAMGRAGAVVDYRQVETDLVTGLAQLGGLLKAVQAVPAGNCWWV